MGKQKTQANKIISVCAKCQEKIKRNFSLWLSAMKKIKLTLWFKFPDCTDISDEISKVMSNYWESSRQSIIFPQFTRVAFLGNSVYITTAQKLCIHVK